MKVKLEEVERYERHVKMRLAFRFGVITVTDATQAVIRVRISLADGRSGHGGAADNRQAAFMHAMTYAFLARELGLGERR